MALPQVRIVLHFDGRYRHAGRLVSPHPSNPGCLDLTNVHCKKAWYIGRIHDWWPVSFNISSKRKTLSQRLTCYHF